MTLTFLYLLTATLAGLLLYLASAWQQLWPVAPHKVKPLRVLAVLLSVLAWAFAGVALGVWAGFFATLAVLMLTFVALPLIDAYRRKQHVG